MGIGLGLNDKILCKKVYPIYLVSDAMTLMLSSYMPCHGLSLNQHIRHATHISFMYSFRSGRSLLDADLAFNDVRHNLVYFGEVVKDCERDVFPHTVFDEIYIN